MSERDDKKWKAVEKVLGEPVFCELSDHAWKIRTNLVVASVVSISVVLAGLHIDPSSSVLGLKFTGLTDEVLTHGLFWVTLYLTSHFLWSAIDNLLQWRLRVTGTRVAFVTTGRLASEHADYPNDPRQSTLYHWWKGEAEKIGNLAPRLDAIDKQLQALNSELRARFSQGADALNIVNACRPISEARDSLLQLQKSIEATKAAILAERIPASLKRFDNVFQLLLRSQNLRWLVVEFAMPVLLGCLALFLLWNR